MVDSVAMPHTAPVAVLDVLNSLLEAELNSVFRFMEEGSPYLSRATVEVRRPLHEMVRAGRRRAEELHGLIEALGGFPAPRSVRSEEQYLAFLSLKFLLPKLVYDKQLMIERYDNALRALGRGGPPEVTEVLARHRAENDAEQQVLQKAAADVIAAAR